MAIEMSSSYRETFSSMGEGAQDLESADSLNLSVLTCEMGAVILANLIVV